MQDRIINAEAIKIEKLATDFSFAEGPLWHPAGYLLFSDTPANKIYKMEPNGSVSVFLEDSGWDGLYPEQLSDMAGSNGLALDTNENIIICQHGNHCLAKFDFAKKNLARLASDYKGRSFNSPNDLVITKEGIIYFTDPPYGLKGQVVWPHKFQPQGGVYCFDNGAISLLVTDLQYPNGICLAPDGDQLYVSSSFEEQPLVLKYKILEKNKLSAPTVHVNINADGIKLDGAGNLFLATGEGIQVVNANGKMIGKIKLAEEPSNLCWGGPNNEALYITARSSIYCVTGIGLSPSV